MSIDMTFSSSVNASFCDDSDYDENCDDVFVKPTNKTLRKISTMNDFNEGVVSFRRVANGDQIPITDVDSILSMNDVYISSDLYKSQYYSSSNGSSISLGRHGLFDTLVAQLEEHCISKKSTFNFRNGTDTVEYEVPVTGHISSSLFHQDEIYNPFACPKKTTPTKKQVRQARSRKVRSWKVYEARKARDEQSWSIRINGNLYNVNNVYKRAGNDFVPFIVHKNSDEPILNIDERSMRSKMTVGFAVSVRFPKDAYISGFVMEPEPMKFEYIYEDVNARSQRHGRGYIKCLVNDPGFVTKFELYYRSSQTDGQWIKHNIYDGNVSNHEPVKITFSEPLFAKEIRIVPLSHYKSFDKIVVRPFNTVIPAEKDDENATVTYTLQQAHTVRNQYENCPDVLCWGSSYWRRHNYKKGDKKIKQREFRELCVL